jgi:hypothetical protein
LDGLRYPALEFDGQNQTEARVGWLKMDFSFKKSFGKSDGKCE